MTRIIIPLLVAAALMACGGGDERAADASPSDSAVVVLPLVKAAEDSIEVVERVGGVAVEHIYTRGTQSGWFREARVRVHDRTVLWDEFSEGMEIEGYWPLGEARTVVLLANSVGGTACDRDHYILELAPGARMHLTERFGDCAWSPDTMWFDRSGALWMRFHPYAPLAVEMDSGYVPDPPATWVYRGGGRLEFAR